MKFLMTKQFKKKTRIFKSNLELFIMTIPGIVLLVLFSYLPMYGLILAFKNYKFSDGIWGSQWTGLKNFEFFFTSGVLGRLLRNTVGLNLIFLIFNTVITLVLALLLYEVSNRFAIRIFQTVIFLPFVVSWVAAAFALYANISEVHGILNGLMEFFGKEPIMFYKEAKYWPVILLICYSTSTTRIILVFPDIPKGTPAVMTAMSPFFR